MKVFLELVSCEMEPNKKAQGQSLVVSANPIQSAQDNGKSEPYFSENQKVSKFSRTVVSFNTKEADSFQLVATLYKKPFLGKKKASCSIGIDVDKSDIVVTESRTDPNFSENKLYNMMLKSNKGNHDLLGKFTFRILRYEKAKPGATAISNAKAPVKTNPKYKSKEQLMKTFNKNDEGQKSSISSNFLFTPIKDQDQKSKTMKEQMSENYANDPMLLKLQQAKQMQIDDVEVSDDDDEDNSEKSGFGSLKNVSTLSKFLGREIQIPTEEMLGAMPSEYEVVEDKSMKYLNKKTKKIESIDPRLWKWSANKTSASDGLDDIIAKIDKYYSTMQFKCQDSFSNPMIIKINRKNIYDDSFKLLEISSEEFRNRPLQFSYYGEKAIDLGGLKRDFVTHMSQIYLAPEYGVFSYVNGKPGSDVTINQFACQCVKDQRDLLLCGRVFAISILYKCPLSRRLSKNFVNALFRDKHEFKLEDLKDEDPDGYERLLAIKNGDVEGLDLTFSMEYQGFDMKMKEDEFVTNGSNMAVNNSNKHIYIAAYLRWYFKKRLEEPLSLIKGEIKKILVTFKPLAECFTSEELVRFLCGENSISTRDLYMHTHYKGDLEGSSEPVKNFWRFLCYLDKIQLSSVLYFALGIFHPPSGGFSNLELADKTKSKFTIKSEKSKTVLMTASTCFNMVEIPYEEDFVKFVNSIILSVENSRGFGGVE